MRRGQAKSGVQYASRRVAVVTTQWGGPCLPSQYREMTRVCLGGSEGGAVLRLLRAAAAAGSGIHHRRIPVVPGPRVAACAAHFLGGTAARAAACLTLTTPVAHSWLNTPDDEPPCHYVLLHPAAEPRGAAPCQPDQRLGLADAAGRLGAVGGGGGPPHGRAHQGCPQHPRQGGGVVSGAALNDEPTCLRGTAWPAATPGEHPLLICPPDFLDLLRPPPPRVCPRTCEVFQLIPTWCLGEHSTLMGPALLFAYSATKQGW